MYIYICVKHLGWQTLNIASGYQHFVGTCFLHLQGVTEQDHDTLEYVAMLTWALRFMEGLEETEYRLSSCL